MARYILCPHCHNVWQISRITKVSYGWYKCPDCCDVEKENAQKESRVPARQLQKIS
jgi:phage FluMu protein Com